MGGGGGVNCMVIIWVFGCFIPYLMEVALVHLIRTLDVLSIKIVLLVSLMIDFKRLIFGRWYCIRIYGGGGDSYQIKRK